MEKKWNDVQASVAKIREATGQVIVGQEDIVEQMLVSLLCKGHCLIVGVPGLAKTLLVSTLGQILGLKFQRIQFTPDLMPTDIVGSEILQVSNDGARSFDFTPGPIFSNLILADEINRTPPKTQAALLEAMQEKQVTTIGHSTPQPETILDAKGLIELQEAVVDVPLPDSIIESILRLVHSTRPESDDAPEDVKRYISYGAGPRASQCLARAVRALALLRGKPAASLDEVKACALPVLRHRVITNYNATGEGITVEQVIAKLTDQLHS